MKTLTRSKVRSPHRGSPISIRLWELQPIVAAFAGEIGLTESEACRLAIGLFLDRYNEHGSVLRPALRCLTLI